LDITKTTNLRHQISTRFWHFLGVNLFFDSLG